MARKGIDVNLCLTTIILYIFRSNKVAPWRLGLLLAHSRSCCSPGIQEGPDPSFFRSAFAESGKRQRLPFTVTVHIPYHPRIITQFTSWILVRWLQTVTKAGEKKHSVKIYATISEDGSNVGAVGQS